MKIIVDCFGGDNAPGEIVKGALAALNRDAELKLAFCGDRDKIRDLIKDCGENALSRIDIIHAPSIITNEEAPAAAARSKRDSSLVRGLQTLSDDADADGFVSAGSTGAVLAAAFMFVGRIKNISRPALAPVLPTVDGGSVILVDCGANVDCKPLHLGQFAVMGAAYAEATGTKNPRIGLLNNGTEAGKGNELTKEAYDILKNLGLNFIGNIEGRDLISGMVQVAVSDGFAGNVALKTAEGIANSIFSLIKQGVSAGGLRAKIGAALLLPTLKGLKKKLDYNENGGACLLGLKKVVIKAHGASKASSVCASVLQARDIAAGGLIEKIEKGISDKNQGL
ncbi:MAG: phosphate acyltransferase PlsX [Clostridiales bacterium]|jgi:glycerol-3-phosphate acyltransferase PlsX|nr:phosphate acyltransferase PlsX [Clostridiales bacterium]